jgi:hypothetical protein
MADHDQSRPAVLDFCEEQIEEGRLAIAVKCRGRLVGNDELWRADQRASGSNPLLLADSQADSRVSPRQARLQTEAPQEPHSLGRSRAVGRGSLPPPRREA